MASRLVIEEWMPALDANGAPIPDATISVYQNETTTLAVIYADEALTTPLDNPLSANSSGQFPPIWVEGTAFYSASISASFGAPGRPTTYDNIQPSAADSAANSAAIAVAAAESAAEDADSAHDNRVLTEGYAAQAQMAALAGRIYPLATANVPRGVPLGPVTPSGGGSGYTNGTFPLVTTGGNFSINPTGTFTVAGNVVTALNITGTGQYIGASPSAPSPDFSAAGGTGATATLPVSFLVQSGETYLANHASRTDLYQVYNNNAGSPQLLTNQTVPKSFAQIFSTRQFVPLAYVSGASSANYTARPIDTNTVLSGFGTQYIFGIQLPFDLNGNHNMAIQNGDGSAFLPLTLVEAPFGGIEAPGAFRKYEYAFIVRNPSPIGDNPGTANNLRRLQAPNTALTTTSEEIQARTAQKPSFDKEVFVQVLAERVMSIRARAIKYDNAALAMDSDEAEYIFYNLARAMSLSTPQCAVAWALNTERALINGQHIEYCQFLSNEGAAASFDREGPSIMEPVCRAGLLVGTALSATIEVGNGHGGLGNTLSDFSMELYDAVSFNGATSAFLVGDVVTGLTSGATGTVYRTVLYSGSYGLANGVGLVHMKVRSGAFTPGEQMRVSGVTKAFAVTSGFRSVTTSGLGVNAVYNCSEVLMRHRYDGYYTYVGDNRFGEVVFTHRINVDGLTMVDKEPIYRVGRRLNFDAGTSAITVGQTVMGGTSGATGVVRSIPNLGATGTFGGGDRAGPMFLDSVTGTWQDNEPILVGGVQRATVNGTLGPVVGTANSYSALMCSTTINRAKIAGFNAIAVGSANGTQRPDAGDNYPPYSFTGTWPVTTSLTGSPMQVWHTNNAVAGQVIIQEMLYGGTAPMTPPGDFSLTQTSKLQIEDRFGGNRKFSLNWVSGDAVAFTGNYTSPPITHRFRVGDPV